MTILDDLESQARLDPQGMRLAIRDLPRQCETAWRESQEISLPDSYRAISKVILAGMGGSAIAGDYWRQLLAEGRQVPVFSHRDYGLPSYLDESALFIACSYSGNTEETLSAFTAVSPVRPKAIVITSGGELLSRAEQENIPRFVINYRGAPRAALGYCLMPLLAIGEKLAIMTGTQEMVQEAIAGMWDELELVNENVPAERNPAKQLALKLQGRLPVLYGADIVKEVLHRWKCQFNENAKTWSFTERLPEANHNAIVAYSHPPAVSERNFIIFLKPAGLHPRLELRYRLTQEALAASRVEFETVEAPPGNTLAQMLTLTLFGDYVSYYLAILNGIDPTPVEPIEMLKQRLAR